MNMRNGLVAEKRFAGAVVYVIVTKRDDKPDTNRDNLPCIYESLNDAEYVLRQMVGEGKASRTIRPANVKERETGIVVHPKRKARTAGLVELFEDLDARKFAISSKADNESEFMQEFAFAFAALDEWEDPDVTVIRAREFGSLMVDLCCKYRGYKAEKVQSRTVLIAGDLEIPVFRPEQATAKQ